MMLTIQSLRDGGYIVSEMNLTNPNYATDFRFASGSIDEALGYIKKIMQQREAVSVPA